jgi:transposase-like protein
MTREARHDCGSYVAEVLPGTGRFRCPHCSETFDAEAADGQLPHVVEAD